MNTETINDALGRANPVDQSWEFIFKICFLTVAICLLFVPSAVFAACTGASPTWSSTVDYSSLNTCVSKAASGDTINVAAGSATWTSGIKLTKSINIIGAGQTSSIINSSNAVVFQVRASSGDFRVSAFGFTGSGGSTGLHNSILQASGIENTGTFNSVRFDHLQFTSIGSWCILIGEWWDNNAGSPSVLVDHITGITLPNNFMEIEGYAGSWKQPDDYGTNKAVYLEDSNLAFGDGGAAVTDTEYGARIVIRNNTFLNGSIQMHDTGSTQGAKGNRIAEIYNNTMDCRGSGCTNMTPMGLRGGGYIVHDNTFTGKYYAAAWPQIWRGVVGAGFLGAMCGQNAVKTCDTPQYFHCSGGDHAACGYPGDSKCSGKGSCEVAAASQSDCPTGATYLSTVDNVNGGSDSTGYPCRNQTGWGMESADGKTEQPSPVYWYNNKLNGQVANPAGAQPSYFQQNRDWCAHDPSTACGTKAGWTYTPYTYPHPLQTASGGGSALQSPTPSVIEPPSYLNVTP